jgi:hypothetical protein
MSGNTDDEDIELRRLRMERMQQLLKAKQEAELKAQRKEPTLADKMDQLINVLLQPQALQYFNQIKSKNIQAYNKIRTMLFPPDIISEIDSLLVYLRQGMIRRGIIDLTEIQIMERQALGIESSITVKKQGEKATSLSNFLKED